MNTKSSEALFELDLRKSVSEAFKTLFEKKHLYQSVRVDVDALFEKWKPLVSPGWMPHFKGMFDGQWVPASRSSNVVTNSPSGPSVLVFKAPDIKTFCTTCNRAEAFNNESATELVDQSVTGYPAWAGVSSRIQVFAFTFICQSCKRIPDVFLVRRESNKITLSGRTPMEHIDVPSFIPKLIQKYYSDALLAHQSGQTLAGNFMLRTLIEQWAYSQCDAKGGTADTAIDDYMKSLPDDFNDRFPSLREIYSDLSEDIHAATGSVEIFERSRIKLVEHFDARRMFKLIGKPEK